MISGALLCTVQSVDGRRGYMLSPRVMYWTLFKRP